MLASRRRRSRRSLEAKVATARFYAEHLLSEGRIGVARLDRRGRRQRHCDWRSKRSDRFGVVTAHFATGPVPCRCLAVLRHLPLPIIGAPLFIVSNAEARDRAVQGRRRRLDAGAERASGGAARRVARRDHRNARRARPLSSRSKGRAVRDQPDRASSSNDRLEHDLDRCARSYKVPIVITSLGARTDVNAAVHGWGGVVMHDIINNGVREEGDREGRRRPRSPSRPARAATPA